MGKKSNATAKATPAKAVIAKAPVEKAIATGSTAVRNSPIPKAVPVIRKEVTHAMISLRAYSIFLNGGGCAVENWLKAERELKGA